MSTYSASRFSAASARTAPSSLQATLVMPAFTAVLHRHIDDVAALWQAFQDQGTSSAYQCCDWVRAIVTEIMPHRGAEPLIVEVVDPSSQRCVMLLPLALTRLKTHSVISWLDLGVCDYAAPLLAPEFAPTAKQMEAAWTAVLGVLPRADLIQIDRISETIGARENPLALLPQAQRMPLLAFGLPIEGEAETLLKRTCSSSANKTLRRTGRKLEAGGEVRFVAATTEADADAIFAALLEQRRQRFRDLGRFDLLDRPEIRDFYRRSVKDGLNGGPARLFGLSVGGRWIATALGLVHGGTVHGILLAMEESWKACSPGLHMATDMMVWARRQGLDEFDFTIGDLPYKGELGAKPRHLRAIAIALTWRGHLILSSARLASDSKAWLQARPHLFEPLRRVRQAVRRWAKV